MRRYIKEYMRQMRAEIDSAVSDPAVLNEMKERFFRKISFFQHERFVHLVTCVMVVNALFISLVLIFVSGITSFGVVSVLLLILTFFYIEHYFFLENSVQKMYKMYDEITDKLPLPDGKQSAEVRKNEDN